MGGRGTGSRGQGAGGRRRRAGGAERARAERQYHIALSPGELAEHVLLCGDPDRAARVASRFDEVRFERRHREYITFTGRWEGADLSVMSTGIGPDNTEIAVIEISRVCRRPTLIRIGSCGALQERMRLGDLVISAGAVRLENTSTFFVHEGYPAVSDCEVLLALVAAAARRGHRHHVGLTATAPGFYGAQCRAVDGFPLRRPGLIGELAAQGVLNYEMETSALLTLASLRGLRAGAVCAVFAHRPSGRFIDGRDIPRVEARCIETGLEAVRVLRRMDEVKRAAGATRWTPEMRI
ncbi:MAG: nucleoside phosphorylase [Euryarchaeota archaeon]|nr:nucleoside phosphorylase [Euryarchaeota archaeon]